MTHHRAVPAVTISLDRAGATPLHRQVYEGIRAAILDQRLPGGARLPSTRALATALRVSRNTTVNALSELAADGFVEGRHGAGTFVVYVSGCEIADPTDGRSADDDRACDASVREP